MTGEKFQELQDPIQHLPLSPPSAQSGCQIPLPGAAGLAEPQIKQRNKHQNIPNCHLQGPTARPENGSGKKTNQKSTALGSVLCLWLQESWDPKEQQEKSFHIHQICRNFTYSTFWRLFPASPPLFHKLMALLTISTWKNTVRKCTIKLFPA